MVTCYFFGGYGVALTELNVRSYSFNTFVNIITVHDIPSVVIPLLDKVFFHWFVAFQLTEVGRQE